MDNLLSLLNWAKVWLVSGHFHEQRHVRMVCPEDQPAGTVVQLVPNLSAIEFGRMF